VRQTDREYVFVDNGGRRPGPSRSVTDSPPELDDRSFLQQNTSPLGKSPCGLFLFPGSPGIKAVKNARSYSYSYSMKWYSYSKGASETPPVNFRQVTPSGSLQWIVTVLSLQCYRHSGSLRWFIQEGSPKELLNKRRKNRDK